MACPSLQSLFSRVLALSSWSLIVIAHPFCCPPSVPVTVPGWQPACTTSYPAWLRDTSCYSINQSNPSSAPVPPSLIKSYLQLFVYKRGREKLNSQVHTAEIKTQSICQPTWRAQCQEPGRKPKFLQGKNKSDREEKTPLMKDRYYSHATSEIPLPLPPQLLWDVTAGPGSRGQVAAGPTPSPFQSSSWKQPQPMAGEKIWVWLNFKVLLHWTGHFHNWNKTSYI